VGGRRDAANDEQAYFPASPGHELAGLGIHGAVGLGWKAARINDQETGPWKISQWW
jgi:hypothetical protein